MNLNERISKIIEYSGLSPSEFADEIDVQRSNISHIASGRNKPSLDFIIKIKDRFPEIDWNWMIKGEGEMTLNAKSISLEEQSKDIPKKIIEPTLASLFSMNEAPFETTIMDEKGSKETISKLNESIQDQGDYLTEDSQRLERLSEKRNLTKKEKNKLQKIVFFFDNGTFEIFEP